MNEEQSPFFGVATDTVRALKNYNVGQCPRWWSPCQT